MPSLSVLRIGVPDVEYRLNPHPNRGPDYKSVQGIGNRLIQTVNSVGMVSASGKKWPGAQLATGTGASAALQHQPLDCPKMVRELLNKVTYPTEQ